MATEAQNHYTDTCPEPFWNILSMSSPFQEENRRNSPISQSVLCNVPPCSTFSQLWRSKHSLCDSSPFSLSQLPMEFFNEESTVRVMLDAKGTLCISEKRKEKITRQTFATRRYRWTKFELQAPQSLGWPSDMHAQLTTEHLQLLAEDAGFSLQWNHRVSVVWCLQKPQEKPQPLWTAKKG